MLTQMMLKRSRGFTLIEVMIVVVIVGILAAIAYPSYIRYVQNTREAETQGLIMAFAAELESHRAKHFSYPDDATGKTLAPELYASDFYSPVYRRVSAHAFTVTVTPKSTGIMKGKQPLLFDSAEGGKQWE